MTTPDLEDVVPFEVDLDTLTMKEIDTIEGLAEGQGIATFMNPQYPQGKILPAMAYICTLRLGTGETWGDLYGMTTPELAKIIAKVFPKEQRPKLLRAAPQDRKPKAKRKPKANPQPIEEIKNYESD